MMRQIFASDFVEATVLFAEPSMAGADRRRFRRERDPLYEIGDEQEREQRFDQLHRAWFERLGLDRQLARLIAGPGGLEALEETRVLRASTAAEEGADLVDRAAMGQSGRPLLVIRLRPATVFDRDGCAALLARELLHVRDMLDPGFGYERRLPSDGALTETMLRERYRVLWDTTIDGRLVRAAVLPPEVRAARCREFESMFSMLGAARPLAFARWFDCVRPTHAELVTFARAPLSAARA